MLNTDKLIDRIKTAIVGIERDHAAQLQTLLADGRELRAELSKAREAIGQAKVHVYRQLHGRHEQDRADAAAWLAQWGAE
jgi:hypothetical protein